MTAGCDPSVFATEIAEYIARAAEQRTEAAAQRERASRETAEEGARPVERAGDRRAAGCGKLQQLLGLGSRARIGLYSAPLVAEIGETEQTVAPSDSSWANPWDGACHNRHPSPTRQRRSRNRRRRKSIRSHRCSSGRRPRRRPTWSPPSRSSSRPRKSTSPDCLTMSRPPAAMEVEPEIYTLSGDSFDTSAFEPALTPSLEADGRRRVSRARRVARGSRSASRRP